MPPMKSRGCVCKERPSKDSPKRFWMQPKLCLRVDYLPASALFVLFSEGPLLELRTFRLVCSLCR